MDLFLPTPSTRRVTGVRDQVGCRHGISTHALRMEGDTVGNRFRNPGE